jgi:hypothetical protein
MHNQIRLGHELVTHGTLAALLVDFPAEFDAEFMLDQYVPKENRLVQDEAFQAVPSWQHETWDFISGDVYEDTFGYILGAAFGTPTKTVAPGETVVWDEAFVTQDDPWSLSLQWQQTIDYFQAFQSLYGVIDEFDLEFGNATELTWKAKGIAMPETEIAQLSAPVLTARRPLVNWQGAVTTVGGANASLVHAKITWKRNRKPFFTINNTQAPKRMAKGMRIGSVELTFDPSDAVGKGRYTAFKGGTKETFNVVFIDAGTNIGVAPSHPQLTIDIPNVLYKTAKIDIASDTPLVKLIADKTLYDVTVGYQIKPTLRSTKDWSIL